MVNCNFIHVFVDFFLKNQYLCNRFYNSNKKMKSNLITFLLLAVSMCMHAQTERDAAISFKKKLEHRIIYYDTQKQAYSTEIMKGTIDYNRRSIQESITFIDEKGEKRTFKPEEAHLFYIKKDVYFSLSFKYKNEQKKAFLHRYLVDKKSGFTFYVYYNEDDQPIYYFRKGDQDEVQAVADDPSTGYVSPIHTYLLQRARNKADIFEPYLDASHMTPARFVELRKVVRMGNINRIPKFRWGLTANIGSYGLEKEKYDFNKKTIGAGGLFADIPLFDGFSLHPELTLTASNYKGHVSFNKDKSSAVYNSTEVTIPIMLRYTFKYISGNILPYVQLGYQPSLLFNNQLEYRYVSESLHYEGDYNDYTQLFEGEEDTKNFTSALTAGAGIEYILKNNHRVYLDVRGAFNPAQFGRTGVAFSVSYNL